MNWYLTVTLMLTGVDAEVCSSRPTCWRTWRPQLLLEREHGMKSCRDKIFQFLLGYRRSEGFLQLTEGLSLCLTFAVLTGTELGVDIFDVVLSPTCDTGHVCPPVSKADSSQALSYLKILRQFFV